MITHVWRGVGQSERGGTELADPLGALVVVRDVMRALNRVSWRNRADPRTVIVFDVENQTGVDSLGVVARALSDSLRAAVPRQGSSALRLVGDSAARATRDASERRIVAVQLGAGATVAAVLARRGADSLRIRVSLRDMSEDRAFDVAEFIVSLREPLAAVPALVSRLAADRGRVNWGPRGLRPPNGE